MTSPDDRRYSETHEWHKLEHSTVTIGISQFAADELTDIIYLEISNTDGPIEAGEAFGKIESVKAISDLYSGIDGVVVAVNQDAINNPAIINEDPYDKGWMIKVEPSDPDQFDALMDAATYDESHGS